MRVIRNIGCRAALVVAIALVMAWSSFGAPVQSADFNRDIRPILSENCFACHGPDEKARKGKLRLDRKEDAFKPLESQGSAIVPGDPGRSKLIQRIGNADEDERMPPRKTGKRLSEQQIGLLRRWVAEGAEYDQHWALIQPEAAPLPQVQNASWPRNAIDYFILGRLENEKLRPAVEADRTALIRRISLDLTGLPPSLDEVDGFLSDHSSDAYEKVVDRLLASPRYGERMAIRWLDAARYADTSGYQSDGERLMWRWRDWVIESFNRNRPFDEFTIEQIAGDMLPNATLDQRIATGFNRNHRGNAEGGIIPEEYAAEYVVDRVDTTSTVWLGLTIGCARCHDHKFDPITQREFYQLFAFFNNIPEKGRAVKLGNSPPLIKAPTPPQQKHLEQLEQTLAAAGDAFRKLRPAIAAAQAEWEKYLTTKSLAVRRTDFRSSTLNEQPESARVQIRDRATLGLEKEILTQWTISDGLTAHYTFDGVVTNEAKMKGTETFTNGEPAFVAGRIGQAGEFDGKRYVDAGNVGDFGFFDKFSFGAWIYPASERGGSILSRMVELPQGEGYSMVLQGGKLQVNLVKRWLDDALRVETQDSLPPNRWHHVMVVYDGSRGASGVKVYANGEPLKLKVTLDELNQSFKTPEPFRIGAGGGPSTRFHGYIDDVRVYDRVLLPNEVKVVATTDTVVDIAAISPNQRTSGQTEKIFEYFLENQASEEVDELRRKLASLRRQKAEFAESLPTVMVMEEMTSPRETFLLIRGQYDKPGDKVGPGVPSSLSPWPKGEDRNRLGFAKWLVDPSNPLTARVAVNQYWQTYFGAGFVRTAEDFGTRGELPSHPALLDWLATEFVRSGWNVKAIQKLIVMSATYRQSSKVTPELLQKDPENRLLARGPRLRLSAEMLRDQALALSGLLVENVGGPSVMPYQPKGLWKELSGIDYPQDKGEKLYRRSIYTFWKRTSAPPSMMTFDASGREMCSVRQTRTSTPLQALTLMNDVTFVEASRVLAERSMSRGATTADERIAYLFRLVTARQPRQDELRILLDGFHDHLKNYLADRKAALDLVSMGEFPRNEKLDVSELAAYTAVASLVLNLDEAITK